MSSTLYKFHKSSPFFRLTTEEQEQKARDLQHVKSEGESKPKPVKIPGEKSSSPKTTLHSKNALLRSYKVDVLHKT